MIRNLVPPLIFDLTRRPSLTERIRIPSCYLPQMQLSNVTKLEDSTEVFREENSEGNSVTKIKCSNSSMERRSAVFDGVTDIQI